MRNNFFIGEARGDDSLKLGFAKLIEECAANTPREAWIIGFTKRQAEELAAVFLREDQIRACKAGKLRTNVGTVITFKGESTLPPRAKDTVILVCFPTAKFLSRVDDIGRDAACLIVVPFADMDEIRPWVSLHGATDVLGHKQMTKEQLLSPKVIATLESLWLAINVSTGVSHPSDKKSVKTAFRELRKLGELPDLDILRSWLVRRGMEYRNADRFVEVALSGKKGTVDRLATK